MNRTRGGQAPQNLTPGRAWAWAILGGIREVRFEDTINRPTEFGVFEYILDHVLPNHPELLNLLPEFTEEERDDAEAAVAILRRVRHPREGEPPVTPAERRAATAAVNGVLNRLSVFETRVREVGRTEIPPGLLQVLQIRDFVDDIVTDERRDWLGMLSGILVGPFRTAMAGGGAPPTPPPGGGGGGPPAVAGGGVPRRFLSLGFLGAVLLAVLLGVVSIVALAFFLTVRALLALGRRVDRAVQWVWRSPITAVQVFIGWPLFVGGIAAGLIFFAGWLAPQYYVVDQLPWWFSFFFFDVALMVVWGARFIILANDEWKVDSPPKVEEAPQKKDDGKKDDKKDKKEKGCAHTHAHGKGSAIDQAIEERQKKPYTIVPGKNRPAVLKVTMGADFLGTLLNLWWALDGSVMPGGGSFVAGLFCLICILDMGQYWNAMVKFEWMQEFLQSLFASAVKPIGALLLGGMLVASCTNRHDPVSLTESWRPAVPLWESTQPAGKPATRSGTSTAGGQGEGTCRTRELMEARKPGYCTAHPTFDTCKCK